MKMREEDIPEVSEESFRYSGPKPQTRESAIISLADMVESASRSLEKPTPQKIEQLVSDLIDQRLADHQLDECDLTLRDLKTIAERFRFTLMNMLHTRIAYPKEGKTTPSRDDGAAARRDGGDETTGLRSAGLGRLSAWKILRSSGCANTARRSRSCSARALVR